MAVRIRVYPQTGALGAMGINGMGAVSASTYYNQKLQTQQQISKLQLGYERALWSERLDKVRLEERLKNPYAQYGAGVVNPYGVGAYNPYASSVLGSSLLGGTSFFGGLGLGQLF